MRSLEHIQDFIKPIIVWASSQPDIQVVALVGSYARGEETKNSDIDIMLLVDDPQNYIADTKWADQFGTIDEKTIEDYGMVTSLRVWYSDSHEVEFGITIPQWGQPPIDEETQSVIDNGMIVLFDRSNLFRFLE